MPDTSTTSALNQAPVRRSERLAEKNHSTPITPPERSEHQHPMGSKLLIDIVKESFQVPTVFAKSTATTDIFKYEKNTESDNTNEISPELKCIEALAHGVRVNDGDSLAIRVDPNHTLAPLPLAIHSEKDVETIFQGSFLAPSLAFLSFIEKRKAANSNKSDTTQLSNEDIMKSKLNGQSLLYGASVSGQVHITDLGIYQFIQESKQSTPRFALLDLIVELKTPAACYASLFDEISPPLQGTSSYYQNTNGWAIEFNWPNGSKGARLAKSDKCGKIISQAWAQMVYHKKRYAVLSTSEVSYCLYRQTVDSETLFLSPPYYTNIHGKFYVLTWIAKALGYLDEINVDAALPEIHTSWWKYANSFNKGKIQWGINLRTVPEQASAVYEELEDLDPQELEVYMTSDVDLEAQK
ncbi:hypothetical protein H0H87_003053 [Tephrocybe sp. NHM501043]|nr:hypothetical protein H0H87_003053 [Tephrocybe sp. NHM501043]